MHRALLNVEKPGRYVGGEWGACRPDPDAPLRIAVCFPDLYEIGMANHAIKILYALFNAIEGVSCERVFAVPPDFESELRAARIPLYSLESGTPLSQFDIVAFSIGYELAATSILSVLELGEIPLRSSDRGNDVPVIIAGGPAVTNPIPFGPFIDAVFIGEMEERVPVLMSELVSLKKRGASRSDLLEKIVDETSFWSRTETGMTRAARFTGFGSIPMHTALPIPGLRTIQDHGVVEIMRGCPNGCRFCHAGILYRPVREKSFDVVLDEVEYLVSTCGYREVTVSSLSTGDYSRVFGLVRRLNSVYAHQRVSFSLPSIRIDTFTLPLLEQVSAVRKSGLTFAVETPTTAWQLGLNKEVSLDRTIEIMLTARRHGWKLAKFYFMLGLPVTGGDDETPAIAEFLETVVSRTGMGVNVNLATFVPKPHTPFQWAGQLDEMEANRRIQWLKGHFRRTKVSVRYNSPFASVVEGVVCRGDERVADIIERAYRNGSRLDAWEDYFDHDSWRRAMSSEHWDLRKGLAPRDLDDELPWSRISLGVTNKYLRNEYEKAMTGELTDPCTAECTDRCGICGPGIAVRRVQETHETPAETAPPAESANTHPPAPYLNIEHVTFPTVVLDVSYRKEGGAVYLSHLDTLRVFERALYRSGIRISFTQGFNPKPRIEFAHPLTLGYSSDDDIARIMLDGWPETTDPLRSINEHIHHGFLITRFNMYGKPYSRPQSLMSRYWGSEYRIKVCSRESSGRQDVSGDVFWRELQASCSERGIPDAATLISVRGAEARFRLKSCGKESNLRSLIEEVELRMSLEYDDPLIRVAREKSLSVSEYGSGFAPFF